MEGERKIVAFVEQAMGAPLTAFQKDFVLYFYRRRKDERLYYSMGRRNVRKWMLEVLLLIKQYEKIKG